MTSTATAQVKLNKQTVPIIGMLSAQLLLGMAENLIGKPDDVKNTEKVLSGTILALHILIGLVLIVRGTIALRLTMEQGGNTLRLARAGFAGIFIAFVAGVLTMAITTGDSWWSYIMTIGFLIAFLAYGTLATRQFKA